MESARPFHHMTVVQLRELARERQVRLPQGVNKAQIVDLLSRELAPAPGASNAQSAQAVPAASLASAVLPASGVPAAPIVPGVTMAPGGAVTPGIPVTLSPAPAPKASATPPTPSTPYASDASTASASMTAASVEASLAAEEDAELGMYKPKPLGYYNEEYGTSNPVVPKMMRSGLLGEGAGVLEVQPGGYGFLRARNCTPGPDDIYVSIAQIRRFGLRSGDLVSGKTRPKRPGDRYSALMYIEGVNGESPEKARARRPFETLTPVHPNRRLTLEDGEGESDPSMRLLDIIAPIGLGQRALIVAPPKAGKTVLLQKIAQAVSRGHRDIELMLLLIDERPEEVTDLRRSVDAEVFYSTFDAPQENHVRVADMVYERAQRLVEQGKDVVVLMDSLTRLARACNALAPGGRAMSGGLAPGVLARPKRFFGAARNLEEGGSLTIIATVLVETGSRMDEVIFEEFKGTGNAEIRLDRALSEARVFPAVDLARSGTRHEELLLTKKEREGVAAVRRILSQGHTREATEQLLSMLLRTRRNEEFFKRLQEWLAIWEKEGYTIRGVRSGV